MKTMKTMKNDAIAAPAAGPEETDLDTAADLPAVATASRSETSMNGATSGLLRKPKDRKKRRRGPGARRQSLVTRNPEELESELREAYFSSAGWVALRYEVGVEEVIDHLRRTGLHHAARPGSAIQYVEDVVLASAAIAGNSRAWHDLEQVFVQPLTRTCSAHLGEQEAMVHVRRFLNDLRVSTASRAGGLEGYAGRQPLRVWLVDRLLGELEQSSPQVGVRLDAHAVTRRLRLVD